MPQKFNPTIQIVITTESMNGLPIALENLVTQLTETIKLDQSKDKHDKEEEVVMAARFKDWKPKKKG
jgi:hypothetical protein